MLKCRINKREIRPRCTNLIASLMSKTEHKRYIQMELDRYPAIRPDKRRWIIAHAFGEIDLRKTGQLLTTDEKKHLGLQPRRFVSSAMISLVEPAFLPVFDIDEALSLIIANARNKYRISRVWDEMVLDLCTSKVEFTTSNDAMTCHWCKAHDHKLFARDFNLPRHIEKNCNCIWFRGRVAAV